MTQEIADITADWVEIIEPTSKERVFTNRTTGEIVLALPPGVAVKPMTQNQWWELLDSSTQCRYYYNPHTEQTVWNKPTDASADIISFIMLQSAPTEEDELDQPTDIDAFDPSDARSSPKTPDSLSAAEPKSSPPVSRSTRENSLEHKLSDVFAPPQQLGRLSPMNLFNDSRFSFGTESQTPPTENSPDSGQSPTPGSQVTPSVAEQPRTPTQDTKQATNQMAHHKLSKSASTAVDGSMSHEEKCMTLDSAMLKNRPQQGTAKKSRGRVGSIGPAPPPPAPKTAAKPSTPVSPEETAGGAGSCLPNSSPVGPTPSVNEGTGTAEVVPSTTSASKDSSGDPLPMAPIRKKKAAIVDNGIDSTSGPKTVKINDPKAKDSDGQLSTDTEKPAVPVPSPSDPKPGAAVENKASGIPEQRSVRKSVHHNRAKSDIIPAPPPVPTFLSSRASTIDRPMDALPTHKAVESIGTFEDLAQHKKGIFRKKVTIHNMLSWTKDPIKEPMIMTRDKQTKKDAVELFRMILQYMGDRRPKKEPLQIALDIVTRGWENKNVRDEIYIQLCRQTSANEKSSSIKCGWELFTICLAFFPPTVKFRSYLEGYLYKHIAPSEEHMGVPVEVYAQYCHKKVEKMTQMGAKKGLKKPTLEEVSHSKDAPFNPSMFGAALEDILEMEAEKFPDHKGIPWVVQVLVDTVLKLNGPQTEGIFRVPGDIDEVNCLMLHVDKGLPPPDSLSDPHIPASLLKLWFRELEEPLIPENYYQECVDNYDKKSNAVSLVKSLPDRNRELLFYIIRFLRKFITPENIEATKMTLDNIAMVWAPNFLRCPSEDHALIFQNTKKEMGFLRLLLKYVETEEETEGSRAKGVVSDS